MKVYEFTYILVGIGDTEEDALADALDYFNQDPGVPSSTVLLEENDGGFPE